MIEYEWTREDLKKELIKKRNKTNLIFLGCAAFLYIIVMFQALSSKLFSNLVIFIIGLCFIFVISILLFITTKIYVAISLRKNDRDTNKAYGTYHINYDDTKIWVTINDDKITYNFKDIVKFKKMRHAFFIATETDKIGLLFKEQVIGKEKYAILLQMMEEKIHC